MSNDPSSLGPRDWNRITQRALSQALAEREVKIASHIAASLGYDTAVGLTHDQEAEIVAMVYEALDSWGWAEAASIEGARATTELQRLLKEHYEISERIQDIRDGRR